MIPSSVERGGHGDPREALLLAQGNPELFVRLQQLGVDLVQASELFLQLRRRVVDDVLVVDLRVMHVGPGRLIHRQPVAIGLEPPLEHELRLPLLLRDRTDDPLVQAARHRFGLDVGDEAVLVVSLSQILNRLGRARSHHRPP
jgi:hypothetical protein